MILDGTRASTPAHGRLAAPECGREPQAVRGRPRTIATLTLLLATTPPAVAADPCNERYTSDQLLKAPVEDIQGVPLATEATYRVANVNVVRQDIFNTDDPAESKALFRLANLWHINTREDVIRTLLLFEEGGAVTAERHRRERATVAAPAIPLRRAG